MAEYDLISKTALLKHLDMAIECKDCPRNADKELYKCVHNPTPQRCTCSEIAQICIRITDFEVSADVQPINQWINAQKNPPPATDNRTSDYVLVLRKSGFQCVCYYVYDEKGNYWVAEDERSMYEVDEVTYWLHLPEPPKDGGAE